MRKVFHPQVASVLQSALREFRRVSHMKVVEMCAAGAAQSRFIFIVSKKDKFRVKCPIPALHISI